MNYLKTVRAAQAEHAMAEEFAELVKQEGFKNFSSMATTGVLKGFAYAYMAANGSLESRNRM